MAATAELKLEMVWGDRARETATTQRELQMHGTDVCDLWKDNHPIAWIGSDGAAVAWVALDDISSSVPLIVFMLVRRDLRRQGIGKKCVAELRKAWPGVCVHRPTWELRHACKRYELKVVGPYVFDVAYELTEDVVDAYEAGNFEQGRRLAYKGYWTMGRTLKTDPQLYTSLAEGLTTCSHTLAVSPMDLMFVNTFLYIGDKLYFSTPEERREFEVAAPIAAHVLRATVLAEDCRNRREVLWPPPPEPPRE